MTHHSNHAHRQAAQAAAPLLTVQAVAERLNVCDRTVRRLIKAGALKALRVGRSLRVSEADFQAYVSSCRQTAPLNTRVQ